MEHFSLNNSIKKEYIIFSPVIENINENDTIQLEVLKKQFETFNLIFLIQILPIIFIPIVLYFVLENEYLFIIPIFPILNIIAALFFLKLRQKKKEKYYSAKIDFDLKKKEVYYTNSISSTFHEGTEYLGSTYKVKLEGFKIDAIIHEKELPQLAKSKFIIERLPKSGIIIKIKNTKVD